MSAFENIAEQCVRVIKEIEDYAIADKVCEDVEQLERRHDALAYAVSKLAGLLVEACNAASAIEARRAETLQDGSVHESAVAKPDAKEQSHDPQ